MSLWLTLAPRLPSLWSHNLESHTLMVTLPSRLLQIFFWGWTNYLMTALIRWLTLIARWELTSWIRWGGWGKVMGEDVEADEVLNLQELLQMDSAVDDLHQTFWPSLIKWLLQLLLPLPPWHLLCISIINNIPHFPFELAFVYKTYQLKMPLI